MRIRRGALQVGVSRTGLAALLPQGEESKRKTSREGRVSEESGRMKGRRGVQWVVGWRGRMRRGVYLGGENGDKVQEMRTKRGGCTGGVSGREGDERSPARAVGSHVEGLEERAGGAGE